MGNGIQSSTFEYLKGCYDNTTKVSDSIHETLSKLFYSYLVVGGMPENVQIYVDTHDIAKVVMNQRSILDLYRLDIAKYASENEKAKIKAIYDGIPSQLNEKIADLNLVVSIRMPECYDTRIALTG